MHGTIIFTTILILLFSRQTLALPAPVAQLIVPKLGTLDLTNATRLNALPRTIHTVVQKRDTLSNTTAHNSPFSAHAYRVTMEKELFEWCSWLNTIDDDDLKNATIHFTSDLSPAHFNATQEEDLKNILDKCGEAIRCNGTDGIAIGFAAKLRIVATIYEAVIANPDPKLLEKRRVILRHTPGLSKRGKLEWFGCVIFAHKICSEADDE